MPDRPMYRPVYKALHRPLTIWGVERRQFFLAMLLGAATFNLFYSFLARRQALLGRTTGSRGVFAPGFGTTERTGAASWPKTSNSLRNFARGAAQW
jgi:hypothetical protein